MTKRTQFEGARKIPLLFNAEELGPSLRQVAVDVIEMEDADLLSRWFHSPNDIDLFIWSDSQQNIIKHQVSFFGQVVEWNVFDGIKTGLIVEHESKIETEEPQSESIRFDQAPQGSVIGQAIALLKFASELNLVDRESLIESLSFPNEVKQRRHALSQRYAKQLLHTNGRPGFWKRVKRWFSGD